MRLQGGICTHRSRQRQVTVRLPPPSSFMHRQILPGTTYAQHGAMAPSDLALQRRLVEVQHHSSVCGHLLPQPPRPLQEDCSLGSSSNSHPHFEQEKGRQKWVQKMDPFLAPLQTCFQFRGAKNGSKKWTRFWPPKRHCQPCSSVKKKRPRPSARSAPPEDPPSLVAVPSAGPTVSGSAVPSSAHARGYAAGE